MKIALSVLALAALALPAVSQAQPAPPPGGPHQPQTRSEVEAMVKQRFAETDANRDGIIDKAEAQAQRAAMMKDRPAGDGPPSGGGRGPGRGMLDRADADGDGKVTLTEALAPALARFDAMDTDKNGTISEAERSAARDAMRAQWQARNAQPEQ